MKPPMNTDFTFDCTKIPVFIQYITYNAQNMIFQVKIFQSKVIQSGYLFLAILTVSIWGTFI